MRTAVIEGPITIILHCMIHFCTETCALSWQQLPSADYEPYIKFTSEQEAVEQILRSSGVDFVIANIISHCVALVY